MTLSEFKAWFEGFTEGLDEPPNAKQWKRIKARVQEITGSSITERIFIDRYRDYYRPMWVSGAPFAHDVTYATCQASAVAGGQLRNTALPMNEFKFDSHAELYAAGKAEAAH